MRIETMLALTLLSAMGAAACFSEAALDETSCQKTVSLAEFQRGVKEAGLYLGGPAAYTDVGRQTLATAIDAGLEPTDKLLDIGAGSLRIAWWLLQYIDPSNYYAIEPVKERLDTAAKILGVDIHLYYNSDFEFPEPGFDFVLARSIWTHASKAMISKMLSEFAENATPNGKFLASVYFATQPEHDYQGEHWIGAERKHRGASVVSHSREWIESEVAKNGLKMTVGDTFHGQIWVLIERAT